MPMYRNRFELYIDSDIEIKPSELKRLVELGAASLEKDDVFCNQIQKVSVRKTVQDELDELDDNEIEVKVSFDLNGFLQRGYVTVNDREDENAILTVLQATKVIRWISGAKPLDLIPSFLNNNITKFNFFDCFPYSLYISDDTLSWKPSK